MGCKEKWQQAPIQPQHNLERHELVSHYHHLPLRRFICKPNVQRSHDFAVVFGNGNKMPQNVTCALCSVDVVQDVLL